jgi:hypothetical protein
VSPVPQPAVQAPALQTWLLVHAVVHAPQWLASDSKFTSQPFEATPSQLANPVAQLAMAHCPETHASVAFARLQTAPQLPQLFTSRFKLTSQPSIGLPLQSAYPGLQLPMVQTPALQLETALGREQVALHAPQLCALALRLTSQPFEATPSQSPNPVLHEAMVQAPAAQAAVAFGSAQALAHPPQFAGSVDVLTSQPLDGTTSQSAHPVVQEATTQIPEEHADEAFGSVHTLPQVPQFVLLVCTLTSQPSVATLLQFANPASQLATEHTPTTHDSVALGRLQTVPHAPQFDGSVCRLTHDPKQLVRPEPQREVHFPALQTSPEGHAVPQAPQFAASVPVLTSHPFVATASQFA